MKRLFPLVALPLVAGCLSSAPPAPVNWTLEWRPYEGFEPANETLPLTLRVSDVQVRAPYSGSRLVVLRKDGSLAFDSYNVFAAAPDKLMRGAASDAFARSKRFRNVIARESQAHADLEVEVAVTRLALDCRVEGRREALVELTVGFVDTKGEILAFGAGKSSVPVGDGGNYSDGFSQAFAEALHRTIESIASLPANLK